MKFSFLKYHIIFAILLFSQNSIKAQNTFINGYIVLNNYDTLHGGLKHTRTTFLDETRLRKIRFEDQKGKKRKFRYSQLRAYNIGGQEYRRFYLRPVNDKLFTLIVNYYEIVPYSGEMHFLRMVRDGELELYAFEWSDSMSNGTESFPLFRKKDVPIMARGTQGIFGFKKKVLNDYFEDCPKLQEQIEKESFKFPYEVADYYNANCASK